MTPDRPENRGRVSLLLRVGVGTLVAALLALAASVTTVAIEIKRGNAQRDKLVRLQHTELRISRQIRDNALLVRDATTPGGKLYEANKAATVHYREVLNQSAERQCRMLAALHVTDAALCPHGRAPG